MSIVDDEQRGKATVLTPRDLRNFDNYALGLVMEMQESGWRGYVTRRGHAFLYAPDGVTTAAVARDSLRGRSGRNARAAFDRWKRAQEAGETARIDAAVEFSHQPDNGLWAMFADTKIRRSPEAMDQIRRSPKVSAYLGSFGYEHTRLAFPDPSQPNRWGMFSLRGEYPELIDFGPGSNAETAIQDLYDMYPDLPREYVEEPEPEAPLLSLVPDYLADISDSDNSAATDERPIPQVLRARMGERTESGMRYYNCPDPDCDKTFLNRSSLELHVTSHRAGAQFKCPDCAYVAKSAGGLGKHRSAKHPEAFLPKAARAEVLAQSAPLPGLSPATVPVNQAALGVPGGMTDTAARAMLAQITQIVSAPVIARLNDATEARETLERENQALRRAVRDLNLQVEALTGRLARYETPVSV